MLDTAEHPEGPAQSQNRPGFRNGASIPPKYPLFGDSFCLEVPPGRTGPQSWLGCRTHRDAGCPTMEAPAAGAVGSTHPKVLPGQRKGIQKSMFNIITGLRFGSASWPVTLPSPSSPLWEHSQDGRAGGESQHEHFGESLQVLLAPCCQGPSCTPGLGTFPTTPLLSQGCSLHRAHPCPKRQGSQEQRARPPVSATATAFTPKGPKMLILKDSRSSRKILPHGSDLLLQVRSCASVSPFGTQRDVVLLLQLHGNGTGRDPALGSGTQPGVGTTDLLLHPKAAAGLG